MQTHKSNFRRPQFSGPRRFGRPGGRFIPKRNDSNLNFKYNRNEFIRSKTVQLIDSQGNNVGEVETPKALMMAREAEMDLVEVAPNVTPPVCKIIKWSKFLYEQEKKQKDTRKNRQKRMKELRFGINIAQADKERLLKSARDFLDKGHNVRISVLKRGRIPMEQAKNLIADLLTALSEYSTIDSKPSIQGKLVSVVVMGVDKAKSSKPVAAGEKDKTKENAKAEDTKNSIEKVQTDQSEGA